jgi:hypothetical protein
VESPSPLELLINEVEQINPAILLAEEFMRRNPEELLSPKDIHRAEDILLAGRTEIEVIKRQVVAFTRSPASPAASLPIGF